MLSLSGLVSRQVLPSVFDILSELRTMLFEGDLLYNTGSGQ